MKNLDLKQCIKWFRPVCLSFHRSLVADANVKTNILFASSPHQAVRSYVDSNSEVCARKLTYGDRCHKCHKLDIGQFFLDFPDTLGVVHDSRRSWLVSIGLSNSSTLIVNCEVTFFLFYSLKHLPSLIMRVKYIAFKHEIVQ